MALGGCFLVKLLALCFVSGFTSFSESIATSSSDLWRSCRCHPSCALSCSHGPCWDRMACTSCPLSATCFLQCPLVPRFCGGFSPIRISCCLHVCGGAVQTLCQTFSCHWFGFGLTSAISLQEVRLCQYVSWEVLSLILAKFCAL